MMRARSPLDDQLMRRWPLMQPVKEENGDKCDEWTEIVQIDSNIPISHRLETLLSPQPTAAFLWTEAANTGQNKRPRENVMVLPV